MSKPGISYVNTVTKHSVTEVTWLNTQRELMQKPVTAYVKGVKKHSVTVVNWLYT